MRSKKTVWVFMVCLALFLTTAAEATIIVSRPGDAAGTPWELGGDTQQSLAVSWLQPTALSGVAINVYNLQNVGDSEMTVFFGLGVDDIDAAPIYTAFYAVGAGQTEPDAALNFGPLDLGPGTWFLTATGTGAGAWWSGDTLSQQEVLGTFGLEYFNFGGTGWFPEGLNLGYQVTGTDPAIPEPGTWALMGAGLLLMGGFLRRRRS